MDDLQRWGVFDPVGLQALRERVLLDEDLWTRLAPLIDETLDAAAFGREFKDRADSPEQGLWLLQNLATAFGEARSREVHGDLALSNPAPGLGADWPRGGPCVVHGDLRVRGALNATDHLLVTGSVTADTFRSGYDHRVVILGDLRARAVATDGALYVGGDVQADLVWTFGAGWHMAARTCRTRVYVNQHHHPDTFATLEAKRAYDLGPGDPHDALREVFAEHVFEDDCLTWWKVMERLRRGEDVWASPGDSAPGRSTFPEQ